MLCVEVRVHFPPRVWMVETRVTAKEDGQFKVGGGKGGCSGV
jgi:hypothetical protein